MTVRKTSGALPILLVLALARPLAAQVPKAIRWSMDPPDSHAPISLTDDRTLSAGSFELGVKYINHRFEGQGVGTDSVSVDQMLDWIAHWVTIGGSMLDKPTHFEVRDGRF